MKSERLLRRIPNAPGYIDEFLIDPISRQAFSPRRDESEGISLYRERFTSAAQLAATGKNGNCYVARLVVSDVVALGLTVIPDVQDGLPGHVLIPELNSVLQTKEKARCKDLQEELSRLGGRDIVHRPPS